VSPAPYAPKRRFFTYFSSQFPHANVALGQVTGNGMEIYSDAPYTDEKWSQPDKNRAAMITRLDTDIGRLLDRLTKSKVDTNTVVIFTSVTGPYRAGGANPEFFNASGGLRGQRGELYEGGLRVPLIVWWPGNVKSGNIVEKPCAMWDLMPTIAQLTGAKVPGEIDGRSLVPALKGQEFEPASSLYWELHNDGFAQAMRLGDWKAIRVVGKALELYNLKQDPQEKKNLATEHPDEVKRITALMHEARTDSDQWPVPATAEK
jgi:arylsulfatase A-like enzyme